MGANDLLEQLQAAQAQSVIDERRIAKLEAELRSLRGEATRLTDLVGMPMREPQLVLTTRQVSAVIAAEARQDRRIAELEQQPGTITPDDIRKAVAPVLVSATRYPRKVQPYILGQDMGPLIEAVVARVAAHLRKDTP